MQDVLGLGSAARMNYPGRAKGNWRWRFENKQLNPGLLQRLRDLTVVAGR
jgi:4-alpha-glucanotransferase